MQEQCKWCNGTGTVNRYNPEKSEYQDYACGFCEPETPQRQAAVKAIADLFADRIKEPEVCPWEI